MALTETVKLLKELCDAIGVSGYEDEVRKVVRKHLSGSVDELRTDPLGSLIAIKRSSRKDAPTLMLDAHMDEVGLVISYIESTGFLRFALIGAWDERVLPAHAVTVVTREGKRIRGVIGVQPPHIQKDEERQKPYKAESLFIDVGAQSREEVQELGIRVGDSAAPDYPFAEIANAKVVGKALDDRAGCAVLIRTLQELTKEELPVHVAAVFAVAEEVGARGAKAAAFGVNPSIALVLEGTSAGDFPGVPEARNPSGMGRGPAITIMDRSAHCSPRVVRLLEKLADQEAIPWQYKKPIFGGTDAGSIHNSREGVLTGVLSVPCRYIHSPHAILDLKDFEHTVRLTKLFVKECRELLNSMQMK